MQNTVAKDSVILCDIVRVNGHKPVARGFVRAGIRPNTYFSPSKVRGVVRRVDAS